MEKILSQGNNAVLIFDNTERKYFSGVDIEEGAMILYGNEKFCFSDERYYYAYEKILTDKNIIPEKILGKESIADFLKEKNIKNLYLNFSNTLTKDYLYYKSLGFNVLDCKEELDLTFAIKSEKEIDSIKKACKITQNAYKYVIENVKLGDTEKQVAQRLYKYMIKHGAEGLAFETIVAFGENSAIPHHKTGDTPLKQDTVILIDMGAKVNGYCADLTRTAFYGKNPSRKFLESYKAVLTANKLAIEKTEEGMSVKDADGIAREYLKTQKLESYFTHSLGHGIGLNIHEYPSLSPKGKGELKNKMVFSIEPGVYFNGEFGIRIEDSVLMNNGKAERLFQDSKDLKIL